MSVDPSESISEAWTRWQGHVIHDLLPLDRCLGYSDHSGVFLTRSAAPDSSEVAVKLVATDRALAESQLPRWKRAGGLVHPHLLGLLQWGGCQLDGLPHLYVAMEYADQTLAQLLRDRALTDDEAWEMLRPTLDALAFLHGQHLVHGQLKPANILVVGDQLKLASDTIRRVGEDVIGTKVPTVYDPPEARNGSATTAGDIWALGVCLFEALTRRPPSGWSERSEAVAAPASFPPSIRDIVGRCLNPSPQNRPSITELVAWAGGSPAESVPEAIAEPAVIAPLQPTPPEPPPLRITPAAPPPEAARPAPPVARSQNPRGLLYAVVAVALVVALTWMGVRAIRSHRAGAAPAVSEGSLAPDPSAGAAAAEAAEPVSTALPPKPASEAAPSSALHEVIPEVSESARRTIIGHIKVWVRVIVAQDGSVLAATADRGGPSKYFQRLAIEAARKWKFPPVDTHSQRVMQIHFDFSRDATTGQAATVQ
ncbi:MAG TPA: protein kinase [Steroidobacteraceae bacterium]|jgi:TonB family protein